MKAINLTPKQQMMYNYPKPKKGLAVDCGSLSGKNPGIFEYCIVDIETNKKILNHTIQGNTTNNIAEFLALVEALKLTYDNPNVITYSDSLTALAWVRNKAIKTTFTITNTNQLQQIYNAIIFLKTQTYTPPLFWNNSLFGETPADYGNK